MPFFSASASEFIEMIVGVGASRVRELVAEARKVAPSIVIAATNRADVPDPALARPGRFDRVVNVSPPDRGGREAILAIHTREIPLAEDVDLGRVARTTPGMTGAELANLADEAALLAVKRKHGGVPAEQGSSAHWAGWPPSRWCTA
ncbi:hypothetical protein AQJ91_27780 [Streptomyces dysideae]|uniref:ATPase AAA-type core domain-containing protein n=1 Tax=Streptomyces dysideae TaxID=909626 RepID=A0A101UW19_9ACTN|nr:hypothetical protein AQJ91_27780 [Streptomyces dysideae]